MVLEDGGRVGVLSFCYWIFAVLEGLLVAEESLKLLEVRLVLNRRISKAIIFACIRVGSKIAISVGICLEFRDIIESGWSLEEDV